MEKNEKSQNAVKQDSLAKEEPSKSKSKSKNLKSKMKKSLSKASRFSKSTKVNKRTSKTKEEEDENYSSSEFSFASYNEAEPDSSATISLLNSPVANSKKNNNITSPEISNFTINSPKAQLFVTSKKKERKKKNQGWDGWERDEKLAFFRIISQIVTNNPTITLQKIFTLIHEVSL